MFQTSKSDTLRIVIISLIVLILIFVWTGFLVLDKKIDNALKQQSVINQSSYETNNEQSRSIRVLQTDTEILMRLVIENTYVGEEE